MNPRHRPTACARRARRLLAWLACACLLLTVGACASERKDRDTADQDRSVTTLPEADGRDLPALGEPLLIGLAQAKNFHHKADIHLQEGDLDSALAAVRAIATIPFPQGAAEAEDVKLDAGARLAKLLIIKGDLDQAQRVVEENIARSTRRSFFLANLYTVKGEVYEARANLLDDDAADSDDDAAKQRARAARKSAIEAFDRSIAINTELQKALMGEGEDTP
jgi:tetratricopeptide (TPR) repeat protein